MQTWLVHMRSPRRLLRELGWPGFVAFQLLVGGTALAALVHGFFATQFIWDIVARRVPDASANPFIVLHATTLVIGYAVSVAMAVIGLARRRLLGICWSLLLMPVYWLLLSLAALRALGQFL